MGAAIAILIAGVCLLPPLAAGYGVGGNAGCAGE